MSAPSVLISTCCDFSPTELVKDILGVSDLPKAQTLVENIEGYPWHIDTKYYTADVLLCTVNGRTIGDKLFAESVNAVVLIFNSKKSDSFEKVLAWLPFLKEMETEVKILVCQNCLYSDPVPRQKVLQWCLEEYFELVELEPQEDSEEEDEDEFRETTGVKRIVQALHAQSWPNLVLKEKPDFRSAFLQQMIADEASSSSVDGTSQSEHSTTNQMQDADNTEMTRLVANEIAGGGQSSQNKESKNVAENTQKQAVGSKSASADVLIGNDDLSLFTAVNSDDPDEESFEKLFEQMRIMKERAENLPHEERKAYAEKVAMSFWRAIGGDEEEIAGLDEDSD